MCGRYSAWYEIHALARALRASWVEGEFAPRANVSPTTLAPMVAGRPERRMGLARFGYTLAAREGAAGKPPFVLNARSETAGTSPAFREALSRRRCLVPVDGYYEWRLENGKKMPYFFTSTDGSPLLLLGLYEVRIDATNQQRRAAFVVLTQAARGLPAQVHDRMPFAFPLGETSVVDSWLDPGLTDGGALLARAVAHAPTLLRGWPVGRAVSAATAEGEELRAPVGAELVA